jgi:hypothetical protein
MARKRATLKKNSGNKRAASDRMGGRPRKRATLKRVAPKRPPRDQLNAGMRFVPGTPAQPGVPNPTVDPFFTPEDLLAINDYQTGEENQLADLAFNLEQERLNTDYGLRNAEEELKNNRTSATEEMIGRGLFASSIKDAQLYDLEGTYARQRTMLNDRFEQMRLHAEAARDRIVGAGGSRERFWTAMNQQKVENAQEVSGSMGPWKVEPKPATPGTWQRPTGQREGTLTQQPSRMPTQDRFRQGPPRQPRRPLRHGEIRRRPRPGANDRLSDTLRG